MHNVAPVGNDNHRFILLDCINNPGHDLLWREKVHWECCFGTVEHTSVYKVRANASGFDVAIVPVLFQFHAQSFVDCYSTEFACTVVAKAWQADKPSHGCDRNDMTFLLGNHFGQELLNRVEVRYSVNIHRALNHRIRQL